MNKKRILAIMGPSGSGKTTIGRHLEKIGIPEIVSHATRPIRSGEVHGVDYYFVSDDEFENTNMVERVTYPSEDGIFKYGISKSEVEEKLQMSDTAFVIVEKDGLRQIKEIYSDMVECIYIMIPKEEMGPRLIKRGDTATNVEVRLERADRNKEFELHDLADHIVWNLDLEKTKKDVEKIIST